MKKGKGGNPYHDPKTGQFTTAGSGKARAMPKLDGRPFFADRSPITRDQGAALIKNLRAMSRRKKK